MNAPLAWGIACAAAMWAVVVFHAGPVPVHVIGKDSVTPNQARVGDTVVVHRSFRAIRNVHVTVSRSMVNGDCKVKCELVDLPSSVMVLREGDYKNVARDYVIPAAAGPGKWTLMFSINYIGLFGIVSGVQLPPLELEILP